AGVYPGAVVIVGRHDTILLARGYGHLTWSSSSPVPNPDSTLFDLASLTKVVATTPAAMRLVETGRLRLSDPVQAYLPEFTGEGKQDVTIAHLLYHTSGLRAYLPLHERSTDSAGASRLVLEEPLRWTPGTRTEYSDLNAILLGWIIERASGRPLDEFARAELFQPLGMTETRFRLPRSMWKRAAPVGVWRGTPVSGTVHDQNAARLGGVAGHAGLFGTGRDLARFAQFLLNGGSTTDCRSILRPETVALFSRRVGQNRSLGFEMEDTTTADNSGQRLSGRAFGHTGFTGTSLWLDPEQDLFVIVLTNRVYAPRASRSITRLKQIRGRIADAAVGLAEQSNGSRVTASCPQPPAPDRP
ncbi:MAG TPA: serine hydrolase domain-containing protein, partial [Gemmatimonadales bacterium]|nr:serine hydrolase domain-containing protein [Gemmatimonadales bacterium]